MKKIVVKFGGSNLKSKEDIQKIIKTIKGYDRSLVIVVSAFYGITNFLTEGLETVRRDDKHITSMIDFIKNNSSNGYVNIPYKLYNGWGHSM